MMSTEDPIVHHVLPSLMISPEALTVVSRLQRRGYDAYFVGGCVRDLLLNRAPKDFDIATAATPDEVKAVFGPSCRLIGRRFRLAHVRVGQLVLEVATFRGRPDSQEVSPDESGFVVRANTFGSAEDDAHSRDFTVNGLFYDPIKHIIYDYVDGIKDVHAQTMHAIGPAVERLREDPVRILRAIRLGTRLNFVFGEELQDATRETAQLIEPCSKARVIEELFRMFETGFAAPSVELMADLGVLQWILPELATHCERDLEGYVAWLAELDRLTRAHGPLPRSTIFVLVGWPIAFASMERKGADTRWDWGRAMENDIARVGTKYAVPVRYRERLRAVLNIVGGQWNDPPLPARNNRSPAMSLALAVMRIQFRLGLGNGRGYEALAERCQELKLPESPFEPFSNDRRDGASRGRSGGSGRGRRRPQRKKTATQA